jgi:hypothetical protein
MRGLYEKLILPARKIDINETALLSDRSGSKFDPVV